MSRVLKLMGMFVFSIFFVSSLGFTQELGKVKPLKVTSPAFENHQTIPTKYGCDGINVNPAIQIDDVPSGTKSLALLFDDQDAPRKSYVHWIVWNIDPSVKAIGENSVPEGAVQGLNDFKKGTYGGPCPPTRPHRYALIVYALDTRLNLDPKSGKAELEKAMGEHVIGKGQLLGVYKRAKKR